MRSTYIYEHFIILLSLILRYVATNKNHYIEIPDELSFVQVIGR